MNARQRKNLLKLAAYLESLPAGYSHFDMSFYADHDGDCKLPMPEEIYAAKRPAAFFSNCGTVACAVGHGPAAGIKVLASEMPYGGVSWANYINRAFGIDVGTDMRIFNFLFGSVWAVYDNHHYGAAARIRYYLATGNHSDSCIVAIKRYAPYRKGSRSAVRRELEAA